MMKEVIFAQVLLGEHFRSLHPRRVFGGLKIITVLIADGMETGWKNAVILTDHLGERAQDAGFLTHVPGNEMVQVERTE